jgi:hypothetical protein
MEKDKSLLDLLDKLRSVFDFNLIEIIDHWEGDLCAIGLKRGNKLVYINTFTPYDFDLELLVPHTVDYYNVIKEGRGVSEELLIKRSGDICLADNPMTGLNICKTICNLLLDTLIPSKIAQ